MTHKHSQRGGALIMVLVGIVLFAALMFTVSRNMQSGASTTVLTTSEARLAASAIINYGKKMEIGMGMVQTNGCSESQFGMEADGNTGYTNAGAIDSCRLFNSQGGGVVYMRPDAKWLDSTQSGKPEYGQWILLNQVCVPGVGTGVTGCGGVAANTDLTAILPWIKREVCIEINAMLGIPNNLTTSEPPQEAGAAYFITKFTGSFTNGQDIASSGTDFRGRVNGCFRGANFNPTGGYHYYHVIYPR